MPDCSVNGTAYPAADLPTDYESVTRAGYAQSMTLVSERPTSAANRRIWPIRFELLTESGVP